MPESAKIKALTARTISILTDLVAFDTTSHLSNLALIDYVEGLMDLLDVDYERLPNPEGTKAALLARVGPDAEGGVILSGHTDVVPVAGQAWDTPPFTLTEKNGKLYGRGSSDMKGFIACALALTPEFAKAKLKRPIYIALTFDEEVGCTGAPLLVKHAAKVVRAPEMTVIGEPTSMEVVTAHKGVYSFETVVTGHEVHSSDVEHGVNAVQIACRLVAYLNDIAEELAAGGTKNPRFDPPYTTVHTGVIDGGTARNIVPKRCRFVWEIRPLPGDNAEAIIERFEKKCASFLPAMKRISPDADIKTTMLSRMKGMQLESGDGREQSVMACAQANHTHAVAFGTEAGVYQEHRIPVVVCGPGSIAQAHQPNEFVEIVQLEKCVQFLLRLLSRMQ